MNYKQITIAERHTIEKLLNVSKLNITQIARVLKRSKSTISREINRNSVDGKYMFDSANIRAQTRALHKYQFRQLNYVEFTKAFLDKYDRRVHGVKATGYGIKNNLKTRMPSLRQVFNGIKSNRWVIKMKDRLRRGYKRGGKRSTGIFSKFKNKRVMPIWVRPDYIDLRLEFGHGEVDLIVGRKATGYANLLTFTERKTRVQMIRKVYSKNPMKINSEIYKLIKENNLRVKTITTDNGLEFEKIGLLAHGVDCQVYYCEPYASYQRGSNEHANGIVRRFFPKKTDFTPISDAEIHSVMDQINNMPREIFGGRSAIDMYKEELKK